MEYPRSSGILLHPTSLPGPYGIGDMGQAAYRWVDFLEAAGQTLWQVMPLGPTGYGDSPYQCFSAFAGNPLLIDLDRLVDEGLISRQRLEEAPDFPDDEVDYGHVIQWKSGVLRRVAEDFHQRAAHELRAAYAEFCEAEKEWLDDYALFMAVKESHGGVSWSEWELDIRTRQPDAIQRWRAKWVDEIETHRILQFQFARQWADLRRYANERGIRLFGDIPIFVAYDSADAWANPNLFYFDDEGHATVVAGVPPDYFSETGQLWGNPLYRWDRMAETSYAWWIARFRAIFNQVDIARIDHFRGFEAYWEVPAGEETAINGFWAPGPGIALFDTVREVLGDLPIIAEDLGLITPEVVELRDLLGFPGMKVLHFAFSGEPENVYLPHNYTSNFVVYTGTHDNDTTLGWYSRLPAEEREFIHRYIGYVSKDIAWDMIRLALSSVANMAIIPLQDVLGLSSEARMNYPGQSSGNWKWRFRPEMLTDEVQERLFDMTTLYGRAPQTSTDDAGEEA